MIILQSRDPHDGTLRDLVPDLTPMLDILFILLVFFMLTAGAAYQSLEVSLPSSVAETLPITDVDEPVMLEIYGDRYRIDGHDISEFVELKQRILSLVDNQSDRQIVIAGDKHISMQRLLEVLTYLQSQNIETANILMKHDKELK